MGSMRQFAWGVLLYTSVLCGAEMTEAMMTEEGWFHSKQTGRYDSADPSDTFSDVLLFSATLRGMWIEGHKGEIDKRATAVGGHAGVETAAYFGFSGMAGVQTSQKLAFINPDNPGNLNPELFGERGNSFTYLSEAEARFDAGKLFVRGGRMKVETPYADPDDIRMAYNTFEGVDAAYTFCKGFRVNLLYLSRWAGFDSGEAQSEFVPLDNASDGLYVAGGIMTPDDETEVSLWWYRLERVYDLYYAEAVGRIHFAPLMHLEWGLQATAVRALEQSDIDGNVLGAMGIFHYHNIYGGIVYNLAAVEDNRVVTDGFGGGPYFTSLDEATVGAVSELFPGEDISVYRVGGGAEFGAGSEGDGLHLEALYGVFSPENSPALLAETDLIFWTEMVPSLRVDAVFAAFDVRDCGIADCDDLQRFWIRLDYTF